MSTAMASANKGASVAAASQVDPTWKGVYKAGGMCLVLAGICFLLGTTGGYYLGVPPGNSEAYLQSLARQPALATATYWMWGIGAILAVPGVMGLYLALKGIDKNAMLLAAGLVGFFMVLDLGVTELNTLALVALTERAATATSEAQRATILAAQAWGLATVPMATFFSWIGPSSGWLIASIVMWKGIFGRGTARLGMITNGLAVLISAYFLFPVPLVGLLLTPILVLYGVWLIATGRRLFGLANLAPKT